MSFAAMAAAVCVLAAYSPEPALALNEKEAGNQYHQQLSREYKVTKDARVTELGKKVGEFSGAYDVEYYAIDLGKDDQPNAFQTPYHIYATKSLLKDFDDISLTYILAHEMGHQVGHHLVKQNKKNQTIGIGAAILQTVFGIGSSTLGGYAINIAGGALINKYSREQEQEADLFGLEVIHDMGIPFAKAADSFRKLGGSSGGSRTMNSLFGSHPLMKDRIGRAETADKWLTMRAADLYKSDKQTIAVVWPYMIEKPLSANTQSLRDGLKAQMSSAGYRHAAPDGKAPIWAKMHRLEELDPDDVGEVASTLGANRLVVLKSVDKKNKAKVAVLSPGASKRSDVEWKDLKPQSLASSILSAAGQ